MHARGTVGDQTMNDPIVDEVRRVRDAHAARFNYDLEAIFQDIKEREKKSGLKFVEGVARQPMPNNALVRHEVANVTAVRPRKAPTQRPVLPGVSYRSMRRW